jgi:hypothetical protein
MWLAITRSMPAIWVLGTVVVIEISSSIAQRETFGALPANAAVVRARNP